MKKHWILDPGHGGMVNGQYVTPGKRSPLWDDGTQYFEGVGNRDIVKRIAEHCDSMGVDYTVLVEEDSDVSLKDRVQRVNALYTKYPNAVLVSVHSNGASVEQANGWEVFTSPGQTRSDQIAQVFFKEAHSYWPDRKMRKDESDGDADKEANFFVLKYTNCPAILTENFFHTNKVECDYLMSEKGRIDIAQMHILAMLKVDKNGTL